MLEERDDGKVKVSLRSAGRADVSAVAQSLGGGGHRFAAGATVALDPEDAVRAIEETLQRTVGKDR